MDVVTLALVAAQAPADPISGFLALGLPGLVIVSLLTGLLVPGYLYKRAEAENDRLHTLVDEKVYPAIEAGTAATREAAEVMKELARILPVVEEWQREQRRRERP